MQETNPNIDVVVKLTESQLIDRIKARDWECVFEHSGWTPAEITEFVFSFKPTGSPVGSSKAGSYITKALPDGRSLVLADAVAFQDSIQQYRDKLKTQQQELEEKREAIAVQISACEVEEAQPVGAGKSGTGRTSVVTPVMQHEAPKYSRLVNAKQMVVEFAEEQYPDLLREFYPRVYQDVGQFYSPKLLAAALVEAVTSVKAMGLLESPVGYRLLMPSIVELKKKRMPLFFLSYALLEAIKRTDFKDEIDWTKISLPFETGVLVLPVGNGLATKQDSECGFIIWSRRLADTQYPSLYSGIPTIVVDKTSFVISASFPTRGVWIDATFTEDGKTTVRLSNLFHRASGEATKTNRDKVVKENPTESEKSWRKLSFDDTLTTEDEPILEQIGVVLFGTLLAMLARPTLLERGRCETVAKNKRTGIVREYWSPNVIGSRYSTPSPKEAVGTHAPPRLHWRRGHFRNQAYGTHREERRVIWLEPCLIGGKNEETRKT